MTCCGTRRHIFLKIERRPRIQPARSRPLQPPLGPRRDVQHRHTSSDACRPARSSPPRSTRSCIASTSIPHFTLPNTAKLVTADVNEPAWNRRIPGSVLYARPGERLYIHVLNGDPYDCHSFHLHGLRYGIESDGAWPFGVATRPAGAATKSGPAKAGPTCSTRPRTRSVPGRSTIMSATSQANVNRGLFGALIVRDPASPRPDHEIPLFVHQLQGLRRPRPSRVRRWRTTACTYVHTFPTAGTVRVPLQDPRDVDVGHRRRRSRRSGRQPYRRHRRQLLQPAERQHPAWRVRDVDQRRQLRSHRLRAGRRRGDLLPERPRVRRQHADDRGRAGRTPTLVPLQSRHRHDLAQRAPAFEPAGSCRRRPAARPTSISLSPSQTFVMDTEAPPAMRIPCALEALQCDPPDSACRVPIKGEFLFHCHIEEHMMSGLAGLVRSSDCDLGHRRKRCSRDRCRPSVRRRSQRGGMGRPHPLRPRIARRASTTTRVILNPHRRRTTTSTRRSSRTIMARLRSPPAAATDWAATRWRWAATRTWGGRAHRRDHARHDDARDGDARHARAARHLHRRERGRMGTPAVRLESPRRPRRPDAQRTRPVLRGIRQQRAALQRARRAQRRVGLPGRHVPHAGHAVRRVLRRSDRAAGRQGARGGRHPAVRPVHRPDIHRGCSIRASRNGFASAT